MSVQLNSDAGTDDFLYTAAAAPNAVTFTACGWARRDANVWSLTFGPCANSGAGLNRYTAENYSDQTLRVLNGATDGGDAGDNWSDGVWRFVVISRSGSDPNGILKLRWLDGSESSLGSDTMTGLSALAPTGFAVGASRVSASGSAGRWTFCCIKVWSGVELSDADSLTEREYRNIQTNTGSVWAHYKFANGALTTDSSANSRTLTSNGAPAFTSDEPAAILGDDPSGGGGETVPSPGLHAIERGHGPAQAATLNGMLAMKDPDGFRRRGRIYVPERIAA